MTAGDLALACALDAMIGDPRSWPHPVRMMGRAVVLVERQIRSMCRTPRQLRVAGLALAVGLPLASYVAGWLLIWIGTYLHEWIGRAIGIALAATTLAWRDLVDHAGEVVKALEGNVLPQARQAVSRIVGRDTETLSEPELVRATVETIAESTSDGIIAPLFYLALGGAPLALAYKAISTLDSMVGHKDEQYRDFGWASARLDDLANWVPARVTAYLIVLAAGLSAGLGRMRESGRILLRDGHKHPSPNSGRPEAAMAGALSVQLGGINRYNGIAVERSLLGDANQCLAPHHVTQAGRLTALAYLLAVAGAAAYVGLW